MSFTSPARGLAALLTLALAAGVAAPLAAQPAEAPPLETDEFDLDSYEAGGSAEGGEMKTLATAALSGWTPLMQDIGYFGALVGRPEQAQSIEGMIALFTQGKGLVGVDKSKPWGVVVRSDGMRFEPMICLPINDLPSVLELVRAFGVVSQDAGGGVFELNAPNSPPMFAKSSGEWVYVSQQAESLDAAPADPTEMLSELVSDYDFGVRAFVQNVPAMFREMAIDGMRQGMQEGLEREPDETDQQYESRKKLAEDQLEQLITAVKELDEITIGLAVNEAAGKGLVIDLSVTAVEGSTTAMQLTAASDSKTRLSGFSDEDATFHSRVSITTPPEALEKQKDQNKAMLAAMRKQLMDGIDQQAEIPNEATREALKSAAGDLFDVYEEIALSGKVDMALTANASPTGMTLLGGAVVPSPEKVEAALKKFSQVAAEEPNAPQVNWNAKSHSGVTFHTLTAPIPPGNPAVSDMLGDSIEVAVGIGESMVYLAAGDDWLPAISAAIDASSAAGAVESTPLVMNASVKSLAELTAALSPESRASAQLLLDKLGAAGDDRVTFAAETTERGVRYRVQVEEGVLRGAAGVGEEMAGQAGGGGGAPPF